MAYLPGFSNDIFISYAHVDNHEINEKGDLWVDKFHRGLKGQVDARAGQRLEIWRDAKLSGESVFSKELEDRLRDSAILIAIVSTGYLKSDWCRREREIFIDAAARNGGLDAGNSRRIIRVPKHQLAPEVLPSVLQPTLGFPLFNFNEQSGEETDLSGIAYRRALAKIACAIEKVLTRMSAGAPSVSEAVYLAETTSDLESEREALRLELDRRGRLVVPREPLPHQGQRCAATVGAELSRSSLSVHLLGKRYGIIPEGEGRSILEIQTEAASKVTTPGFRRIVWIPRGVELEEEVQRAFLDRVRKQIASSSNFELLETPFEELKTSLIDALAKPVATASNGAKTATERPTATGPAQVYLVRDKQDRGTVAPLFKYLFDQGLEVTTPQDDGDPAEIRENHVANLKYCDAVMIWWGSARKTWLQYMMRDLDQAPGFGRSTPFRAKAVCISSPISSDKDDFMTQRADVIRFSNGFSPEPLAPLLATIRSGARA